MIEVSMARAVRCIALTMALTTLASCGPTSASPSGVESSSSPPAPSVTASPGDGPIHGTYDVGGYDLFIDCTGTGKPTVVMLAGAFGGSSADWTATRDGMTARTCAYDRRNVGLSTQVPGRSTGIEAVEDLHQLLQVAGVEPPYVLAGHSYGGMLSLLYAGTYPDEVAGIVLVDATMPFEVELDPPEIAPKVRKELNDNPERIDFYETYALTDSVLDRLPAIPITYLFALQQNYPKEWEEGAYPRLLRAFIRGLPNGRLVEFDTDHDVLLDTPADVAEQIQQMLGVLVV
jgi:pimeloyl-ACP methyl ester carboxylesterase